MMIQISQCRERKYPVSVFQKETGKISAANPA